MSLTNDPNSPCLKKTNSRSKAGKLLAEEWKKNLTMPNVRSLTDRFEADMVIAEGGAYWTTIEQCGSDWIIRCPVATGDGKSIMRDFVPADAIALKTSEYWQIKEDADRRQRAGETGAK